MDKVLKPEKLDTDPDTRDAECEWLHWQKTFENFLEALPTEGLDKLRVLTNYVSPRTYRYIRNITTYNEAIDTLKGIFVQPKNEIYARHMLATRSQQISESVAEYLRALTELSKDCNFQNVSAKEYQNEYIRDSFILGLNSSWIRQRLLENKKLTLDEMVDQAKSLETAVRNSQSYAINENASVGTAPSTIQSNNFDVGSVPDNAAMTIRTMIPHSTLATIHDKSYTHVGYVPSTLRQATALVEVGQRKVRALFDSGSTENYIHPRLVKSLRLNVRPTKNVISMASSKCSVEVLGCTEMDLYYNNHKYCGVKFGVIDSLCADMILGLNFQTLHKSVRFHYGGKKPELSICGFSSLKITPPEPFKHLTADCHPIATKSRRYSHEDRLFIRDEVARLQREGIIETCLSPWRAQVVVVKAENRKKRLAIDYSQTINKFTLLDAFPLPNISELVNEIAQYRVFSTVDLTSAYHQVPLKHQDREFTAFEAEGNLYQFTRLPFGITNGVSCFQRIMKQLVKEEQLRGVFPYLDNITICGMTKEDHDKNLAAFLESAKQRGLIFNESKSIWTTRTLPILGYQIAEGEIRPDPERLKPLRQLPIPSNSKELSRCMGFFSYYSRWIPNFSNRIRSLTKSTSFPLTDTAIGAFYELKQLIENAVLIAVDENIPFELETDASDIAIAATLNQSGRPVAFFSRTLHGSELKHPSVEKEAMAIVEAVRHWRHFLTGRRFIMKTDQKSVSYMFDLRHKGKIKNEKITRWRIELSGYSFDIAYKPGKDNVAPDTLSRISCALPSTNILTKLHDALCHPGISIFAHFVRVRNLPYSTEDVKRTVLNCRVCREIKPKYYRPEAGTLVKATQPFERLSIDFKGPLPSNNRNKYFLCVIDEFSRFPFAIPTPDVSTASVIKSLTPLFAVFGMPAYIHTDRGSAFMSCEFKRFLQEKGVSHSRTTPYNPSANGQVERSLLCTATNATPHERLFNFARRSTTGYAVPTWLTNSKIVLLKRQIRRNKSDPYVDEVELLDANRHYAHIRYSDGKTSTVSTKHLAPCGDGTSFGSENNGSSSDNQHSQLPVKQADTADSDYVPKISHPVINQSEIQEGEEKSNIPGDDEKRETSPMKKIDTPAPRRSTREKRPIDRLHYYE
uniref:uncharacterized protein LOC120338143 n=1 Tax=Styela clava TaxID=7725 RepID=UPI00193A2491|nr:uncharacterized protein LOC120338143 [Styela clava]